MTKHIMTLNMSDESETDLRQKLLELGKKKAEIESQIAEFSEILKSQNVDMKTPLIDSEGFPRNDIDIYQVREARQRINCLQNDHKALMKTIEEGLHALHAKTPFNPTTTSSVDLLDKAKKAKPIAKIDRVEQESPAEESGLQTGDLLVKFGSISEETFKGLNDLAEVVQHSIGQSLTVIVKRNETEVVLLKLTPKTWKGRGYLGCNITPIK